MPDYTVVNRAPRVKLVKYLGYNIQTNAQRFSYDSKKWKVWWYIPSLGSKHFKTLSEAKAFIRSKVGKK